jgi:hypothetical protein
MLSLIAMVNLDEVLLPMAPEVCLMLADESAASRDCVFCRERRDLLRVLVYGVIYYDDLHVASGVVMVLSTCSKLIISFRDVA